MTTRKSANPPTRSSGGRECLSRSDMRPYDTGHHTHVNVTAVDGGAIMDVPMERVNAAKNAALWVLKIMLAALFLLVGIQKLLGRTAWVDLFAMAGYPEWFRTVVGVIETVC